tara:strand:+ start:1576 stop:3018 length:1443 start_codon:yes stop_codon:yes gene_type:complete
MTDLLWKWTAHKAVEELKSGRISPLELIDSCEKRIADTNNLVNALPTLCFDRARKFAKIYEQNKTKLLNNSQLPDYHLHGLPIAIKDLMPVKGVRSTMGSTLFKDNIPKKSDVLVSRLESNGAIIIGKSNTPEFGAGGNTFNDVFGATLNPWDTSKTCGGSSGGAAVALATGQVWLAHGSDLGGSLRTPASFCGVTGLRPSPGCVPKSSSKLPFHSLFVEGPMARNAIDVGLFLDAMAGHEYNDPLSYERSSISYKTAAESQELPNKIAYSPNLGFAPVVKEVKDICENISNLMASNGATVELAEPDLSGAIDTFHTLRAAQFAAEKGNLLKDFSHQLKPELIWNIQKGLTLTAQEIYEAEIKRGEIYSKFVEFFEDYDLLICPAAIVPPFDVNLRYVDESAGVKFDNYIDWIAITYVLSLSSCPIAATPAGITADGLPVGVQLVAPPRREDIALSSAGWLENKLELNKNVPMEPINNGS